MITDDTPPADESPATEVGSEAGTTAPDVDGSPLLKVENLVKTYKVGAKYFWRQPTVVEAVKGVSFSIGRGETFALVGESGSGKSTIGRAVLRLIPTQSGSILFDGTDLTGLSGEPMRLQRKKLQAVFQDPLGSLNPRMTCGAAVAEVMTQFGLGRSESETRARKMFDMVGLSETKFTSYPRQLSGGQRQRVGIARAIALNPKLIVLDEAVSALDVSVQAQIINLLAELQRELGLSYLFISHDLAVVRHISQRIGVLNAGEMVELGSAHQIFTDPQHDYTTRLLESARNPVATGS